MIRLRIEGTEEEMLEFMEKMPDIPGFEKTHMREPRRGNNPKYDSSKNVLAYLSYKKIEVANEVNPENGTPIKTPKPSVP